MKAGEVQCCCLLKPTHNIHRLHAVAGGALDQVVYGRHHHNSFALRVPFEADIAVVRAGKDLRLGIAINAGALFDDPNERLFTVLLPVNLPNGFVVQIFLQERMAGS